MIIRLRLFFLSRLLSKAAVHGGVSVRSSFLSCRLFCDVFYFRKPASRYRSACFFVVFLCALSVGVDSTSGSGSVAKRTLPCAVRAGESEEGGRAVSGKVSAENCEAAMDILLFCPWRQGTAARDALFVVVRAASSSLVA